MQEKRNCAVVVSLNPCVDKTVWIDKFIYGGTNRVQRAREDVAGKGTNVCVAFQSLGQDCICVGFDYAGSRKTVAEYLSGLGGHSEMVTLPGAMRVNMKLFESSTGVMSEVNEKGETISAENLQQLLETLDENSVVILTGSIPPGVPTDIYYTMIQMAKAHRVRTLLDASGEPLLRGADAIPYAMKPNQDEIGQILGREINTLEEAIAGAKELIGRGVEYCCVSLGGEGAIVLSEEGKYLAKALKVPVQSTVGAGDSMVAAMAYGHVKQLPREAFIRLAVAMGAASCMCDGTQAPDGALVRKLAEQVEIMEV